MAAELGNVKWNPTIKARSSSKYRKIRFRLYTGVSFLVGGIFFIILHYLVKI